MNFILKTYKSIDNDSSLQLDMSFQKSKKNLNNIKQAVKKYFNNNIGEYVLIYEFNNNILEVIIKATNDWVKEYNKITTFAYIYIYNIGGDKYLGIKSKSQSGYNNFLVVLE